MLSCNGDAKLKKIALENKIYRAASQGRVQKSNSTLPWWSSKKNTGLRLQTGVLKINFLKSYSMVIFLLAVPLSVITSK